MVIHKVKQDKNKRTFVSIPSFLRDKFNLKKGDDVEIDFEDGKITVVKK